VEGKNLSAEGSIKVPTVSHTTLILANNNSISIVKEKAEEAKKIELPKTTPIQGKSRKRDS
jgi:hypothetical protein